MSVCLFLVPSWRDAACFREFSCVEEYVLIGEPGCCGDLSLTWGLGSSSNSSSDVPQKDKRKQQRKKGARQQQQDSIMDAAAFVLDGWEREELKALTEFQLSQFDCQAYARNSTTVAFRRRQASAVGGAGGA